MLKLTRKNLLAWLNLLGYRAENGIGKAPDPAYEPVSFKERDEDKEAERAEKRRAK